MTQTYAISIGPALTEKIQPMSAYWPKFNSSFKNREVSPPEFANLVYEHHAFTTWHSNNWRTTDNYLQGQHLGLDFDTMDEQSSIPVLLADPFISKYASLIYTTPSHTPDAPRARVVFLLDRPIRQAKNYALSATALLWLFGGTADRQCKDAVRFFYGAQVGGDIEWLPNILPLGIIKDMIARYKATGQQQKRTVQNYQPTNADEREVQDALKMIPPWGIDYQEWLMVLMAIHSEFPGSNGLSMAESWGQGAPGEVSKKWASFKPTGNEVGTVTIRTLFKIAMDHGYSK
jgi:hypothetical protein